MTRRHDNIDITHSHRHSRAQAQAQSQHWSLSFGGTTLTQVWWHSITTRPQIRWHSITTRPQYRGHGITTFPQYRWHGITTWHGVTMTTVAWYYTWIETYGAGPMTAPTTG